MTVHLLEIIGHRWYPPIISHVSEIPVHNHITTIGTVTDVCPAFATTTSTTTTSTWPHASVFHRVG